MKERKRVGLALGAGSARGLAHIGVLQVLAENRVPVDLIVGSSMGALVGGVYACGSDMSMLGKLVYTMDNRILFDIGIPRMGFVAGRRATSFIQLLTKNRSFEESDIPLVVMATDLVSGRGIAIDEGPIAEAVRASISIPGVFKPVKKDGMILVDGAVSHRLPVEEARSRGCDLVIAVDVTCGDERRVAINNTIDVFMTALDIMIRDHFELTSDKGDILIQPAVGSYSSSDFENSRRIIELGREAAEAKIGEIIERTND
ncbi:MAG: patatin-like phospholipase family protein [Deltaproteobacteria bacterium]